jgi:hypothetical protein
MTDIWLKKKREQLIANKEKREKEQQEQQEEQEEQNKEQQDGEVLRQQGQFPVPGTKRKVTNQLLRAEKSSKPNESIMNKAGNSRKEIMKSDGWKKAAAAAGIQLSIPTELEEIEEIEEDGSKEDKSTEATTSKTIKKKTPQESRTETVKVKTMSKLNLHQKKNFKESFNSDKSRLDKRQEKFGQSPNFLLIMEDNVDSAACTSGKFMVYGKGKIASKFFNNSLKFNKNDFFVHKKALNFEEDCSVKPTINKENKTEKTKDRNNVQEDESAKDVALERQDPKEIILENLVFHDEGSDDESPEDDGTSVTLVPE